MTSSNETPRPLAVIGAGGHAKVVAEAAVAAGFTIAGFIDGGKAAGSPVLEWQVLGDDSLLGDDFVARHAFAIGIGDQAIRWRLGKALAARGAVLPPIVHPRSVISPSAAIGAGTVVCGGVVVNAAARIGRFCILNTACSIDHDSILEDNVQICPGARLAGNVSCGENAFVGTGSIVVPDRSIGANAYIGAGITVASDVPANARMTVLNGAVAQVM